MNNLMKFHLLTCLILSILILESCVTVFSDLQSARLVGKGNIEATPSYSKVSFSDDGDTENVQTNFGAQVGFGLSENMDLRVRIEHISVDDADLNVTALGVGPKFSIVRDRITGYIPIGAAFGADVSTEDSFEIHPTLLFTLPLNEVVEFNPSIKYIISLSEGGGDLVAINFGFGIGEYGKFVIRPEYGLLFNPGESGHYQHFSLGVNLYPKWGADKSNY